MKLSPDQEKVWKQIKQGKNLFVTARAGTGKSFLINYIQQNFKGGILVTASTGIAANNVGGRTLHSRFMINPNTLSITKSVDNLMLSRKGDVIYNAKLLIIDEVSMVSDRLLKTVDEICRKIRYDESAFGGLQVLFFGDFLQLPPVFKDDSQGDRICLGSDSWVEAGIETVLLTTNFRQGKDKEFQSLLTRLRYNKLTDADESLLKSRELEVPDTALRLYSLNAEVDSYNRKKYNMLDDSTERIYTALVWGEDKNRVASFKRDTLMEEELKLRLGARVMMLVNTEHLGYYIYNGAMGTVIGYENGYPKVKFDLGVEMIVMNTEVTITELDKLGREVVLVSFTQVPLRLAYACTVHKAQGMTFDSIYFDCSNVFIDGQVYVALSRVTSLSGLFIKGFNKYRARSSQVLVDWYIQLEQTVFDEG